MPQERVGTGMKKDILFHRQSYFPFTSYNTLMESDRKVGLVISQTQTKHRPRPSTAQPAQNSPIGNASSLSRQGLREGWPASDFFPGGYVYIIFIPLRSYADCHNFQNTHKLNPNHAMFQQLEHRTQNI